MRRLAQLCIAVGAVLGVLSLVGLGWLVVSDRVQTGAQQDQVSRLTQEWDDPTVSGGTLAAPSAGSLALGQAFAIIRAPRLGGVWQRPIVEGTDLPQLKLGVGHYAATAFPGQVGNFSVAGHSSGPGAPFGDLARLRVNDTMTVQTPTATFVYRVTGSRVVKPTDVWVLNPTPGQSTMTVTTCYPVYAINPDRLVVSAVLVPDSSQP